MFRGHLLSPFQSAMDNVEHSNEFPLGFNTSNMFTTCVFKSTPNMLGYQELKWSTDRRNERD